MTEEEWLACDEGLLALRHLHGCGQGSEREAVEAAELCAEGAAREGDFAELIERVWAGFKSARTGLRRWAAEAARGAAWPDGVPNCASYCSASAAAREAAGGRLSPRRAPEWHEEQRQHAKLLRDVYGNPFRPASIDPGWLTPAVKGLAAAAYEERDLPSGELDPARLSVLADALEEAGCADAELLSHLRSPGPHVRGCRALDLILGKG